MLHSDIEVLINHLISECENVSKSNPRFALLLGRMASEALIRFKFSSTVVDSDSKSIITIGDLQTKSFTELRREFTSIQLSSLSHINQMTSPFLHFSVDYAEEVPSELVDKVLREIRDLCNDILPSGRTSLPKNDMTLQRKKTMEFLLADFMKSTGYITKSEGIRFNHWEKIQEYNLIVSKWDIDITWKTLLELEFSVWNEAREPNFCRKKLAKLAKNYEKDAKEAKDKQSNAHMYAQGIRELLTLTDQELLEKETAIMKEILIQFYVKFGQRNFSNRKKECLIKNSDLRWAMLATNCICGPHILTSGMKMNTVINRETKNRKKYSLKGNWLFMEYREFENIAPIVYFPLRK